jgi:hypothetical protein
MSMNAGTDVVVDENEAVTAGSGLKLELYTADKASLVAAGALQTVPVLGDTAAPYSTERPAADSDVALVKAARVRVLRGAARQANVYGAVFVAHITTNAKAKIKADATADGLQNYHDAVSDTDQPTKHPDADKLLPII